MYEKAGWLHAEALIFGPISLSSFPESAKENNAISQVTETSGAFGSAPFVLGHIRDRFSPYRSKIFISTGSSIDIALL